MNKTELIVAVAEKTGTSKAAATESVNAALDAIQNAVANGDDVAINGFGTFKRVHRPARDGRNPSTGAPVRVEAKNAPVFSAGASFKAAVNA